MAEAERELQVSEYLGRMSVLWVGIPDEPGSSSERAYIERNAIGLLSNGLHPHDVSSSSWLGWNSDRDEIRGSGLWNVNHVYQDYDPAFLRSLAAAVDRMPV
jgi:hypothetical protein